MRKTPDEIKKGLECCMCDEIERRCDKCPYADDGCETMSCERELGTDTIAYVQQLEERNAWHESDKKYIQGFMNDMSRQIKQLEAERDAAVADLAHVKDCDTCKYDDACLTGKKDCFGCHEKSCPCLSCKYEWRGVQKEE